MPLSIKLVSVGALLAIAPGCGDPAATSPAGLCSPSNGCPGGTIDDLAPVPGIPVTPMSLDAKVSTPTIPPNLYTMEAEFGPFPPLPTYIGAQEPLPQFLPIPNKNPSRVYPGTIHHYIRQPPTQLIKQFIPSLFQTSPRHLKS